MGVSDQPRWILPPFPNGWFLVVWSDELPLGAVRSLAYLGRQLVAFRGADGAAHVLDAFCPHLGAHLGVGGRVVDGTIECPFHAWRFDGGGACVGIPYAKKIPKNASVRSWPVREVNGAIFVHYDEQERDPDFEIPVLPEVGARAWTRGRRIRSIVRAPLHEINENTFDNAHLVYIHGYDDLPDAANSTIEEAGSVVRMVQRTRGRLLGRPVGAEVTTTLHGPGFHTTHVRSRVEFLVVVAKTPIDGQHVEQWIEIRVRRRRRLIDPIVHRIIAARIERDQARDRRIWEHKTQWARPLLCEADGPIMRYRRWYGRFYGDGSV